jgi:hypothetical protein
MHSMRLLLTAIVSTLMAATMALAKNCIGSDCKCGDTLVANFILPGNISCPNVSTAINIGSGVTLDCAGHTISGNYHGPNSIGIRTVGTNAVVRRCNVTGFYYGYRIDGSGNLIDGQGAWAWANGQDGVGYGVNLVGSGNHVQGLRVYANADEGIHISAGADQNVIAYVESWENRREQIYALDNSRQILWYNRVMGGTTSIRFKNVSDSYLEGNTIYLTPVDFDDLSLRNTIVGGTIEQTLWRLRGIAPAIPSQNRFLGVHFSNPLGTCVLLNSADGNVFEDSWFDCGAPDVACTDGGVNTFVRPRSGESGETDGTCSFVVQ